MTKQPDKKPKKNQRDPGEYRVTRKHEHEIHAGGESWAVSYADLLMVLLSFFVMFFSLKEEKPEEFQNELQKISQAMRGLAADDPKPAAAKGEADDGKVADLSKVSDALKIDGVKVEDRGSELVITLEQDAFVARGYKMSKGLARKVDEVLARLVPFQKDVMLTVVGHADSRPIRRPTEFIQDNFDLSSIRALSVLKYVVRHGFPEGHASARASAHFDRDARSISLVIRPGRPQATEGGS